MSKIVVIYYSSTGHVHKLAEALAKVGVAATQPVCHARIDAPGAIAAARPHADAGGAGAGADASGAVACTSDRTQAPSGPYAEPPAPIARSRTRAQPPARAPCSGARRPSRRILAP